MSTHSAPTAVMWLFATIRIAPTDVPAFLDAFRPAYEGVIAESENIFFEVTQDPEKPGLFRFVEAWTKDKEWFMTHQIMKPYYGPYIEKTEKMWIEDRKLEMFERVPGWSFLSSEYMKDARS